jgi:hypothetical protein
MDVAAPFMGALRTQAEACDYRFPDSGLPVVQKDVKHSMKCATVSANRQEGLPASSGEGWQSG